MIASEGGSTEPYVAIRATAEVHKDPETKRMLWGPHLKKFIKDPENPKYVAIRFIHRGSSIIAEARWKSGSATKRNESMAIVIIEAPRPPEKWETLIKAFKSEISEMKLFLWQSCFSSRARQSRLCGGSYLFGTVGRIFQRLRERDRFLAR
jgi:hypothetical protein